MIHRTLIKPLIVSCDSKKNSNENIIHRKRLLKIQTDVKVKLKEKKEQAQKYCVEVFSDKKDYDIYCIILCESIEVLESKQRQLELLLRHIKE